jgi:hypothetical protein
MVCRDKVASRIAHNRNIELLERFDHIFAETILVDQVLVGVPGIVQAAVDAASHVLCETAIDVVVDFAQLTRGIHRNTGLLVGFELRESRHFYSLKSMFAITMMQLE